LAVAAGNTSGEIANTFPLELATVTVMLPVPLPKAAPTFPAFGQMAVDDRLDAVAWTDPQRRSTEDAPLKKMSMSIAVPQPFEEYTAI
jgi:hypothetical protein